MTSAFQLVLGTHNQKKRRELEILLAGQAVDLLTLQDIDNALAVEETATTFAGNAMLKATEQAKHLGKWVLGEDSGLSVEALGGEPGVYSARYAGVDGDDLANNRKLVESLRSVSPENRQAWYTCHMTLSDPQGAAVIDVEATCRGQIVSEPRGTNGFGYDPHFEIPEYHRTFGELGDNVKSVISHRAKAMRRFLRAFSQLRSSGLIS